MLVSIPMCVGEYLSKTKWNTIQQNLVTNVSIK
jgi:hypothetical protein